MEVQNTEHYELLNVIDIIDEPVIHNNKDKKEILKKIFKFLVPLLFLFVSCAIVIYYIIFPSKGEFQSDCTDTLYWAQASYDAGKLFNPDFGYAALLPFGGNLIMQPLISLFGITMKTHIIGMLIFFVLFVSSVMMLLKSMKWSFFWQSTGTSVLLLTLCMSKKLREIFWGHIIYYSLGVFFLMICLSIVLKLLYLANENQTNKTRIQEIIFLLILFLYCVFCSTNQMTIITLFALPVLGGLFVERILDRTQNIKSNQNIMSISICFIIIVGVIVGIIFGGYLIGDLQANYAESHTRFTDSSAWRENAEKLPIAWMNLFGLSVKKYDEIFSLKGIKVIFCIVYSILVFIFPVILTFLYSKIKEIGVRILIWVHWILTIFILIGYICGFLSTANWRLSPALCTSVLLSVAFIKFLWQHIHMRRIGILLCIPVFTNCILSGVSVATMPYDNYKNNIAYKLADYLDDNNLYYGYAGFWTAQAVTVVSDSKVKVRSVVFEENNLTPYYYQSNFNWFDEQPNQKDYFVIMTPQERELFLNSGIYITKMKYKELRYLGYYILVFGENIF